MQTGTTNGQYFIRSEIWEAEIKEELFPALTESFPHMKWLTGAFPDGDTLTIPTTGRVPVRSYVENNEITVDDPTNNEIQLVIDKYYQAGLGVTDKFKQDSYMAAMAIATWRQDMVRGLKEKIEADVFNTIHSDTVNGQTLNDSNNITVNGTAYKHRWAASGTSEIFDFNDFRHAKFVHDKANVPKNERVAFVDPKVSHDLLGVTSTDAGAVYRQDVYGQNTFIQEGFGTGSLIGRFYGYWVFETNMLPTVDSETLANYAGTGKTVTSAVVNQFLGLESLFGAFRQNIEIEQFRDPFRKRDVMSACLRFGTRVYRPESVIAVLSV